MNVTEPIHPCFASDSCQRKTTFITPDGDWYACTFHARRGFTVEFVGKPPKLFQEGLGNLIPITAYIPEYIDRRVVKVGVGRTYKEAAKDAGIAYTPPKRKRRPKGNCDVCPAKNVSLRPAIGTKPDGSDMMVCRGCYREGY